MKQKITLVLILLLLPLITACGDGSEEADEAIAPLIGLCDRLFPERSGAFQFVLDRDTTSSDSPSRYSVVAERGKVTIKGSDPLALSVGLNRYLSEYCHTYVSPYAYDKVELPGRLPDTKGPLEGSAVVPERFFLNYCTFGYSMPYWKWADWERLIDWMALQGVTMPLAITGQEKVWLDVWTELGLDPESVKSYFTGPAHLPWHRMNNIDRWEGPLPDSWLDEQVELQKKILERERSFGMTPVLPAFAGHVPQELARHYPDADVLRLGEWGGFEEKYGTYYLSPASPLFRKIQTLYLEKQTELFGTDHIYGIDAFNEVDSPDWSPEFLADVSRAIHISLTDVDSEAKWLMMTWLFYYDKEHWTPERIRAFLEAVPQGSIYLLDYYCDKAEVWRETEAFYGQPYLWCYLGNFGGNSWLCGNMRDVREKLSAAQATPSSAPMGIACTLEGLDANPIMYEYVLSQAWTSAPTADDWIRIWADKRGNSSANNYVYEAWKILESSVYRDFSRGGQAVLIHARPCLHGYQGWCTVPDYEYDNDDLLRAWQLLLQGYTSAESHHRELTYDLVNVGRQLLGNRFMELRDVLTKAYEDKDLDQVSAVGQQMEELMDDYASLLTYEPYFTLGKWLRDARDYGSHSEAEADYYERNARSILTVWGQPGRQLTDYANRAYAGLVTDYYAPRWKRFIESVESSLREGIPLDEEQFRTEMIAFEDQWRQSTGEIAEVRPSMPIDRYVSLLISKYFPSDESR